MDKRMTELEKEVKNLKEQNKILLDRMEKHINEKSDIRKELYKYCNPNNPSFKEGTD
jgi:predicted RNase H-like nuclease (RuvC/YqgF family)